MKARIRKNLRAEVRFDFTVSSYARDSFLANVVLVVIQRSRFEIARRVLVAGFSSFNH
jgi:hypothetical protein